MRWKQKKGTDSVAEIYDAFVVINYDSFKFGFLLLLQGTLTAIRDWFRDYKIPDGKPANKFGLGNKAANKVNLS